MKALMISRDSLLHAEVAAQGSARMPALQLVASRNGLRDAVERQLPETPELVIVDASDVGADEAELVERLSKLYPSSSFMLLTREPQQEPADPRHARRHPRGAAAAAGAQRFP